jgi:hypothetical protein
MLYLHGNCFDVTHYFTIFFLPVTAAFCQRCTVVKYFSKNVSEMYVFVNYSEGPEICDSLKQKLTLYPFSQKL